MSKHGHWGGCLVLVLAGFAGAEERAATASLPAALHAVGGSQHVVTERQAAQMRGQATGAVSPLQSVAFQVVGQAQGQFTLFEGVVAQFRFANTRGLQVEGTIGGLQGAIGVQDDGTLSFAAQGKALQQTGQFTGQFQQVFSQAFGISSK